MKVLFMQTADPVRYKPIWDLTSRTVTRYCCLHDFNYEAFVGIWRGSHPWHAAYNRIPMLERALNSGYSDWVCYLDADAFVVDLEFDLRKYLGNKGDRAFIAAAGGEEFWCINDGVMFVNLGHPVARDVIRLWSEEFNKISDGQLQQAVVWDQIENDQLMLQRILRGLPSAEAATFVDHSGLLNYSGGRFIKQTIRAGNGSFQQRFESIRHETDRVLGSAFPSPRSSAAFDSAQSLFALEQFLTAIYRVAFFREPDPPGFASNLLALREGRTTIEQSLRAAFSSEEFAEKSRQFLDTYVQRSGE